MLSIPWTARLSNDGVMRISGVEKRLLKDIRKKQFKFVGRIMRAERLERNCILERVKGTRPRKRQRLKHMDALVAQLRDG